MFIHICTCKIERKNLFSDAGPGTPKEVLLGN